MSDAPKCCGTCRWWERLPDSTKYGDCVFEPLPESVTEAWFYMLETAGKDCPCHAPREANTDRKEPTT